MKDHNNNNTEENVRSSEVFIAVGRLTARSGHLLGRERNNRSNSSANSITRRCCCLEIAECRQTAGSPPKRRLSLNSGSFCPSNRCPCCINVRGLIHQGYISLVRLKIKLRVRSICGAAPPLSASPPRAPPFAAADADELVLRLRGLRYFIWSLFRSLQLVNQGSRGGDTSDHLRQIRNVNQSTGASPAWGTSTHKTSPVTGCGAQTLYYGS